MVTRKPISRFRMALESRKRTLVTIRTRVSTRAAPWDVAPGASRRVSGTRLEGGTHLAGWREGPNVAWKRRMPTETACLSVTADGTGRRVCLRLSAPLDSNLALGSQMRPRKEHLCALHLRNSGKKGLSCRVGGESLVGEVDVDAGAAEVDHGDQGLG